MFETLYPHSRGSQMLLGRAVPASSAFPEPRVQIRADQPHKATEKRVVYKQQRVLMPACLSFDRRLRLTDYRTLHAVALHCNKAGETYVGQKTLGQIMRISGQAAGKSVRRLIKLGYLRRVARRGQGYVVRIVWMPEFPSETTARMAKLRAQIEAAR